MFGDCLNHSKEGGDTMNDGKIKIIACEVMKDEISSIEPPPDVDFEFVPMGYHLYPKKLGRQLQEIIDRSIGYSRVILAFGLCGGAAKGLKAANCPLTIPRIHDCVSIFLSSDESYIYEAQKEMGIFYLTTGWMISERSILSDHERVIKKYGQEKACSVLKRMYDGYKKVLFIKTGCPFENEALSESKQIADLLCVKHEIIQRKSPFFEQILKGPWDDQNFININPSESIAEEDFSIHAS
jgi:hypothetical protein